MVDLDRKVPAWGLSRWGLGGLCFHPADDEGYALRGDSRHVLYKGRDKSHRFTILDSERFEYDIILKKEQPSNRLYLFIDGWEQFDFFRQPDHAPNPALSGSYAVYRKENIVHRNCNTGTGKLCHIHRPKIIDSRGREVWGDIWIDKGVLCITIPEQWLAGASYPVIVDPIIGCSSVGANYYFYFIDNEEYEAFLADYIEWEFSPEEIEESFDTWKRFPGMYNYLLFNRYTTTAVMQGKYNVHFHSAKMDRGYYNTFAPVVFNDLQNIPNTKISNDEYGYAGTENESAGWKQASLNIPNMVTANSSLWLGVISNGIGISFDYGGTFFDIESDGYSYFYANPVIKNGQSINTMLAGCGNYIADYRSASDYGDSDRIEELRPSIYYQNYNVHPKKPNRYDYKFSFYLESVSVAYNRTLTAGVRLTDTRKGVYNAVRKTAQTVKGSTVLQKNEGFCRNCIMNVTNSLVLKGANSFIRTAAQQIAATMGLSNKRDLQKTLANETAVNSVNSRKWDSKRMVSNSTTPGTVIKRSAGLNLKLIMMGGASGTVVTALAFFRNAMETIKAEDIARTFRGIVRTLTVPAGNSGTALPLIGFKRDIVSGVNANSSIASFPIFFRKVLNSVGISDTSSFPVFLVRRLLEQETALDQHRHIGGYIRGLYIAAGSLAETGHTGEYYRKQTDTAHIEAVSLRHLFIFIRLLTTGLVRDFILRQFLKSNEELVLKSCVCREITLESSIH